MTAVLSRRLQLSGSNVVNGRAQVYLVMHVLLWLRCLALIYKVVVMVIELILLQVRYLLFLLILLPNPRLQQLKLPLLICLVEFLNRIHHGVLLALPLLAAIAAGRGPGLVCRGYAAKMRLCLPVRYLERS